MNSIRLHVFSSPRRFSRQLLSRMAGAPALRAAFPSFLPTPFFRRMRGKARNLDGSGHKGLADSMCCCRYGYSTALVQTLPHPSSPPEPRYCSSKSQVAQSLAFASALCCWLRFGTVRVFGVKCLVASALLWASLLRQP